MTEQNREYETDDRTWDDEAVIDEVEAMTGNIANQLEAQRDDAADGGTSGGSAPGGRGGRNRPAGMGEGTSTSASGGGLSAGVAENTGTTRSH